MPGDRLPVGTTSCHGVRMEIIEWWSDLDSDAKAWLVAHNGEAVSPEVLSKIVAAGGSLDSSAWWVGESGPDGFYLSDEAVDWIETAANDESY
jgi:hypothetical protein